MKIQAKRKGHYNKSNYQCYKKKRKKLKWIVGILISVDQFGNAIAFGNPDSTISARVGFFSENAPKKYMWYWRMLEVVINFAFWSIDGPNHCKQAFCSDSEEDFYIGNQLAWILLTLIIYPICLIIAFILYLLYLIYPDLRKVEICAQCSGLVNKLAYKK